MFCKIERFTIRNHIRQDRSVVQIVLVEAVTDSINQQARSDYVIGIILTQKVLVHLGTVFGTGSEKKIKTHDNQCVAYKEIGIEAGDDCLDFGRCKIRIVIGDV